MVSVYKAVVRFFSYSWLWDVSILSKILSAQKLTEVWQVTIWKHKKLIQMLTTSADLWRLKILFISKAFELFKDWIQLAFTCSKVTIEILEQGVEYAQSS